MEEQAQAHRRRYATLARRGNGRGGRDVTAETVIVLNWIDLICTLWALRRGCVELNPLMRSVPFMVCYKVIIVGALLWWLSTRRERAARRALYVAAVVYGAVDVYHMINILR